MSTPGLPLLLTVLASRTVLFASFQALLVAGLAAFGSEDPIVGAQAWWMWAITLTNVVSLAILGVALRQEGTSYARLVAPDLREWRADVLPALAFVGVAGVTGVVPVLALGTLLWGDLQVPASMMFAPLPIPWAVPGLVTGVALAAQHLTAPWIADRRFLVYRGLMFLPFAILVCATLAWRPRLLPYLMVVHVLIDVQPATLMITG